MDTAPYKLSFTGAGLAVSESLKIAEAYIQLKDWEAVRRKAREENILQARTGASLRRTYREIAPRLVQLNEEQIKLLVEGSYQEQRQLLWYAVCKRYAYIREFAVEVLHEKFMRLDYELTDFDYQAFFSRKADWHEELDRLTKTTRVKIKTVLFRMLREAGLISEAHQIIPTTLLERVAQALNAGAPGEDCFRIFPIFESNHRTQESKS